MKLFSEFNYVVEILLAELIFLNGFPRRKRFALRLAPTAALTLFVGYFIPFDVSVAGAWFEFAMLLLTIGVSVAWMYFSFSAPFLSVLSACCAGVAVQHIGHHVSFLICLLPALGPWNPMAEFVTCLALDGFAFLSLRGVIRRENAHGTEDASITVVSVLIVLICIGITRVLRMSDSLDLYASICASVYAITCCLLALSMRFFLYRFIRLKGEHLVLQHIREEEKRQFELDRENAELLSVKAHDLKHVLVSLDARLPKEETDSLREIVDSYDATYHTGLDALDIILNEKNLRCRGKRILLTCMGNGAELGFMDIMDVYSLFGNILENAIAAVEKIEAPGKRLISLIIEQKGSLVLISALNYADTDALTFTDGLPNTTKQTEPGCHGYGMKSIRSIARKYDGDISVNARDGMFEVRVYMLKDAA